MPHRGGLASPPLVPLAVCCLCSPCVAPPDCLSAPFLSISRASRCSARCLECSQQGLLFPGTAIQDSIDEERGGALHSTAFATFQILLDAGERALVGQSVCVLLHIETNRLGKLLQVGILKRMLVVEDVIMHLPELTLSCGGFGSQSRVQRVGMDLGEREVAKDKAQLLPELLLDRSHDGRRLAGVGAFVVAILDQRDSGCCRSLTVVPLTNGDPKMYSLCHRPLSFWFYQESDVKGERFSSEDDASVPSPHLTSPAPTRYRLLH